MSLRWALRAAARVFVALALVASIMPFASGDAEARRRGGRGGVIHAGPSTARSHTPTQSNVAAAQTHDAAGADAAASDVPLRAQTIKPVKPAPVVVEDRNVPGCTAGSICTVCLAGCYEANNGIVHTSPKARQAPPIPSSTVAR